MSSDSETEAIERTVCTVKECFAYKIPPPSDTEGYFASNWKEQIWVGSIRVVIKGVDGKIELYNHKDQVIFATAFIRDGKAPYEGVKDSSRYFALKIENKNGKKAYVGIGFQERTDAFDFNVSVQDFIKQVQDGDKPAVEEEESEDFKLKEGEKLNINIQIKTTATAAPKLKKSDIKAEGDTLAPPPSQGRGRRKGAATAPKPSNEPLNLF